jgi:hypothetical protein
MTPTPEALPPQKETGAGADAPAPVLRFNPCGVLPTVTIATTMSTAAAATARAAATGAAATRTILGLIDPDVATVNFGLVQAAHGCVSGCVFHFNEAESAGAAGVAIENDFGRLYVSVLSKKVFQCLVVDAPGEVSDKKILHTVGLAQCA